MIGLDAKTDLAAVIYAASPRTKTVALTSTATNPGEAVFQLGYPQGWNAQRGTPHQRTGVFQGHLPSGQLKFSFLPIGGDSGGGIYRASDGALLAVVSMRAYPNTNHGWGTGNGGDDVARFMKECCLPFIHRLRSGQKPNIPSNPKGNGGTVPTGPAGPADPGATPTTPEPAKPAPSDPRIDALATAVERQRAELDKANELILRGSKNHDQLKAAHDALADDAKKIHETVKTNWDRTTDHTQHIAKAFDMAAENKDALTRVQDGLAKAHAIGAKLDQVADKLGGVEALAGDAAKVGGWAAWLPAIATGAGIGGPGAAIAISLALAALRRKAGSAQNGTAIPPATNGPSVPQPTDVLKLPGDKQDLLIDLLLTARNKIRPAEPTPPAQPSVPAPVMTTHEFVPINGGNAVADAYEWAHRTTAEKYPGMAGAVQMIESLAKQRLSGAGAKPDA